MEQGDGLEELFGDSSASNSEAPAPPRARDIPSVDPLVASPPPVIAPQPAPGPPPLPTAPPVYQQVFSQPTAPPRPFVPSQPEAPVLEPALSPSSAVTPTRLPLDTQVLPPATQVQAPMPVQVQAPAQTPPAAFTAGTPYQAAPPVPAPSRRDPDAPFDFQLRPRRQYPGTTPFEWSALALAIVLPPIGLVVSIIARGLARSQRRWRTRVASVATGVAIALTLVLVAAGGVYLELQRQAAAEAELVRQTAPLCNLEQQFPGVLEDPTLGWPAVGATIPESVAAIEIFHTQWSYLARVLPAEIKGDAAAVAGAAQEILDAIATTRVVDSSGNSARMTAVAGSTGLSVWAAQYCG